VEDVGQVDILYSMIQQANDSINSLSVELEAVKSRILRLETAISQLSAEISNLQANKSTIASYEIDQELWRGKNRNDVSSIYTSSYVPSIESYAGKVNDAAAAMAAALQREMLKRDQITASIGSLRSHISSLYQQIRIESESDQNK
jgi:phage shock protein A